MHKLTMGSEVDSEFGLSTVGRRLWTFDYGLWTMDSTNEQDIANYNIEIDMTG